jgi:hypothetical protein
MNPIKGKGERYIYCPHDSECLDLVARKGWMAFNCEECEVYLGSSTYEEKQILEKKTEKKRREGMGEKTTVIDANQKSQLIDLNDALFKQMDRLTNDDLTDDQLQKEIARSKAVSNLAAQVVQNAKLVLEAARAIKLGEVDSKTLMLGRGEKDA